MFLRKVIGSSRGRKDFGVQIWEDRLHLKDHLPRLRTGLGHVTFLLVKAGVIQGKKKKDCLLYSSGLEYLKLSSVRIVLE